MYIRYTKKAAQNLDDIFAFLNREYPGYAEKIFSDIIKSIENLVHFPNSGRAGRVFGTRELIIKHYPYIVPYRIKDDAVQILRVFHPSQKPPENW